ncbi:MAG: NAD-dependent epimerase [Alistipes sp.]|nr:NAD-dependent epimerase [Alistipes sp.]
MKILITGAAGFIGFHLAARLLREGHSVVGLDSLNDYYDVRLKLARLAELGIDEVKDNEPMPSSRYAAFRFVKGDLADRELLPRLFAAEQFDVVVNLAAQAGVRYSLENPFAYVESNLVGFVNLLECCRHYPVKHLVYASSSSVYGGNTKTPFSEEDRVDNPVSLYAATKKSNELMAACYAHLYGIPSTGLRFFTVYGPWGRPDMAPMLFTKAILAGEPIKVFNAGNLSRDFTYIDDIVEGVVRIMQRPPQEPRHAIYNIGGGHPIPLMDFIHTLEELLDRKAVLEMLPMQPGDVYATCADSSKLETAIGYKPTTSLREGLAQLVAWYQKRKK